MLACSWYMAFPESWSRLVEFYTRYEAIFISLAVLWIKSHFVSNIFKEIIAFDSPGFQPDITMPFLMKVFVGWCYLGQELWLLYRNNLGGEAGLGAHTNPILFVRSSKPPPHDPEHDNEPMKLTYRWGNDRRDRPWGRPIRACNICQDATRWKRITPKKPLPEVEPGGSALYYCTHRPGIQGPPDECIVVRPDEAMECLLLGNGQWWLIRELL